MGIWEELFGKHRHHTDPVVKDLLEIIKKQQNEALMAEANKARLIKRNTELTRRNSMLQKQLFECMNRKPHRGHYDVIFS